jgi:hypothetical protein
MLSNLERIEPTRRRARREIRRPASKRPLAAPQPDHPDDVVVTVQAANE